MRPMRMAFKVRLFSSTGQRLSVHHLFFAVPSSLSLIYSMLGREVSRPEALARILAFLESNVNVILTCKIVHENYQRHFPFFHIKFDSELKINLSKGNGRTYSLKSYVENRKRNPIDGKVTIYYRPNTYTRLHNNNHRLT